MAAGTGKTVVTVLHNHCFLVPKAGEVENLLEPMVVCTEETDQRLVLAAPCGILADLAGSMAAGPAVDFGIRQLLEVLLGELQAGSAVGWWAAMAPEAVVPVGEHGHLLHLWIVRRESPSLKPVYALQASHARCPAFERCCVEPSSSVVPDPHPPRLRKRITDFHNGYEKLLKPDGNEMN